MRRVFGLGLCMVLAGLAVAAAAEQSPAEPSAPDRDLERPVFHGQVEVNLINLYVTVLDSDGNPVAGLEEDDFTIYEDGDQREITNFEALDRSDESADGAASSTVRIEDPAVPAGVAKVGRGRQVALLFDCPSLGKRNRRRMMGGLEDFVRDGLAQNDRFLIAANTGELEIIKDFSSYDASVLAALRRSAELPTTGEAQKISKRYLKRTIYSTNLYRVTRRAPGDQGFAVDVMFTRTQAQMLLSQIEAMRSYEADRIRRSLAVVDELIRSMAGLDGRKAVIWIGEDLALRPGLDLYRGFYTKAYNVSRLLNLNVPEVWGEAVNLVGDFRALVTTAQACGVSFFVIDTSDRDREAGNADFKPPSMETLIASEGGGRIWTPGMDVLSQTNLTEGGEYMALATGGSAFAGGRNVDQVVESLKSQVSTYYYLGYRRPGPPDGKRHRVDVKVAGNRLRVRHHESVLDRTAPQRLADLAMSRLRLDAGLNPLGLEISLAGSEPAEKGLVVQEINLSLPVDRMVLLPTEARFSGQLLVAVAVLDENGRTAPPRLLRLHLALSEEEMMGDTVANQAIRLLMKPGTRKIAISVRDEVSGVEGSGAVDL